MLSVNTRYPKHDHQQLLDDDWGNDHEQPDDDEGAFTVLYVKRCGLVQPYVERAEAQ